jgi:hypothetical protein
MFLRNFGRLSRTTRRYIPEHRIVDDPRCENLKSVLTEQKLLTLYSMIAHRVKTSASVTQKDGSYWEHCPNYTEGARVFLISCGQEI